LISHCFPPNSEFNDTLNEIFEEDICSYLFASPLNEERVDQVFVVMDMHFQNFDYSLDEDYWRFLGDPFYDSSSEEVQIFKPLDNLIM
jgi:hypothetical protein